MWNYAPSSKICEKKQQAESYDKHIRLLKKAKATVDNCSPYKLCFTSRLTNKYQQQRDIEINRSNSALLKRMMHINMHISDLNKHKQITSYKELSSVFKNKKLNHDQVNLENSKIANRLSAARSYYERDEQIHEAKKYIACRNNISQNARRSNYFDFGEKNHSYGLSRIRSSRQ